MIAKKADPGRSRVDLQDQAESHRDRREHDRCDCEETRDDVGRRVSIGSSLEGAHARTPPRCGSGEVPRATARCVRAHGPAAGHALAVGEPTGRGCVGKHWSSLAFVGGQRLSLDRIPDDDAQVDDRDFQNDQHEDDLPDHALVSLRDRQRAGTVPHEAARPRGWPGRPRMRARGARCRTSSPSLGLRPRPRRVERAESDVEGAPPACAATASAATRAYARMPTAIAPRTNAFRARMRSVRRRRRP